MKDMIYSVLGVIAALTVFAFLYPEYALTPDMYVYCENGVVIEEKDAASDFYQILDAKGNTVVFKFALADAFTRVFDMEGKQTCQKTRKQPINCDLMIDDRKLQSVFLIPESVD